jgi:hypothetical protein
LSIPPICSDIHTGPHQAKILEKFSEILPTSPVAMTNPSTDNSHERQSSSVHGKRSAPIAEPESKHDQLEISSSFVSLEEQEIDPEIEKQQEIEPKGEDFPRHEVYEADLSTWRLFVIVGG